MARGVRRARSERGHRRRADRNRPLCRLCVAGGQPPEKWELSLFTMHLPRNHCQLVSGPVMPPLEGHSLRPRSTPRSSTARCCRPKDSGRIGGRRLRSAMKRSRSPSQCARRSATRRPGALPAAYRTLGETPAREQRPSPCCGRWLSWPIYRSRRPLRLPDTRAAALRWGRVFRGHSDATRGVVFTVDQYEDAWNYVQHEDGRLHLVIPELLDELAHLDENRDSPHTSAEFPLVLSAGERRSFTRQCDHPQSIGVDAIDAGALRISPGGCGFPRVGQR